MNLTSIDTCRRCPKDCCDELHLTRLEAEEEDPKVAEWRRTFDQRIGEAQLPDLILGVDTEVRFSWIMLGREPRSGEELLMAYAGILAPGTSLTATECARSSADPPTTQSRFGVRSGHRRPFVTRAL